MTRIFSLLSFSFFAAACPQIAAAQSVTLDPGLYKYSHVMSLGGRAMPAQVADYCVKPGENSRTLEELVSSLAGDSQCKLSNVRMTDTTGRADLFCTETELGMDIVGTLDAKFGSDFYNVDTRASFGPMQVLVETRLRRSGECAVEAKPPVDVTREQN